MIRSAIIDTGPLVALLDPDEKYHKWADDQIQKLSGPLLVCESVLTEATFLLKRVPDRQTGVLELLRIGALEIKFSLAENAAAVKVLLDKYHDIGISLADACIVRMTELYPEHPVFTLDSDFHIYRKHGRQSIQLIAPMKR